MSAPRGFFIAVLFFAASCGRMASSPSDSPRPVAEKNVISREELQDPVLRGMDALQTIRYLRPAFFRDTGPQSFFSTTAGALQFSMDYGPVQPLSQLSILSPLSLQMAYQVRYLDINEAQNRFGISANGGPVIVVVNNKQ